MKPSVEIAISFPREPTTAALKVVAPAEQDLVAAVGSALAAMSIRPDAWYSIEGPTHRITYANLREADGSPLSQRRAAEALRVLGRAAA